MPHTPINARTSGGRRLAAIATAAACLVHAGGVFAQEQGTAPPAPISPGQGATLVVPPPASAGAPPPAPSAPSAPPVIYEPPPPPPISPFPRASQQARTDAATEARVRAPELSLWVGVRGGWDWPAGAAFVDAADQTRAESSIIGSGPLGQIDIGARVTRNLVPFVFYAHTFGRSGSASTSPGALDRVGLPQQPPTGYPATIDSARSELLGLGMRYLFSPDDWGAALEITYAYRLTRATFSDGTTYRANAPGLVRLGAGLEIRSSRLFTWSPMVVATLGSYSDVTVARTGATERSVMTDTTTHAYLSLVVGGSFDLLSRWEPLR